jgi:Spy/CpxP family protein refolding chaperone
MRKTRLAMIGLAVSLLAFSGAYAQEQNAERPEAAKVREEIYKELNLSAEQNQKLEANRKEQREKMLQLRNRVMGKEKQMRQAIEEAGVSRAGVEQLANELKDLQGQMIDQRVNGIYQVKEILTKEQFAKLNQIMEKRKEKMKERFQDLQKKRSGLEK